LDVTPEDRIVGENLFKDKAGYLKALNGIYGELNKTNSFNIRTLDYMGQYYNYPVEYRWEQGYGVDYLLETNWANAYSLIINCNEIILQCGEAGNPVLAGGYYNLYKGEAIALRAMLHLDLLRYYGPMWSQKEDLAIPYMTKSDRQSQPLLPATAVLDSIINDLKIASALLETVDPVITQGTNNAPNEYGDTEWSYRQYRLNYYAAQLLLARAYLWGGDTQHAGETARKVISEAVRWFPFVTDEYMAANGEDRIFSPEVLFAFYNTSRTNEIFNTYFNVATTTGMVAYGSIASGRVSHLYDSHNDVRYKMWLEITENNITNTRLQKYAGTSNVKYGYMVPRIRMSEAYLIAAECDPDVQTALTNYLNPVRYVRKCPDAVCTTSEELNELIQAEYLREFIGEGQLFFYFKRRELPVIPVGNVANGTQTMTSAQYVAPLPESEREIRGM
jgi:hypothetical protein